MIEMSVYCDFCNQRMPVVDGHNVKLFKTKEINTKKLFPHLCERCANKMDEAIRFNRGRMVSKSELSARMAKINEERRKKLNSKG